MSAYLGCELDEAGLQSLGLWLDELRAVEVASTVLEGVLAAQVAAAGASAKATASLTTGSQPAGNRFIITAKTPGTWAHAWTFTFVSQAPSQVLAVTVTGTAVLVELETEDYAHWIPGLVPASTTAPSALVALLSVHPILGPLFAFTNPDAPDFSVDPMPATSLAGGGDASVTSTEAALNRLFGQVGSSWREALAILHITDPTATSALAATGLMQLVSGKLFAVSGTNLVELRALWELINRDTARVISLLAGNRTLPIVVFTRSAISTTAVAQCQGGGTVATTTVTLVGQPNVRPSDSTGLDPNFFWLESVTASAAAFSFMTTLGLSQSQQLLAYDSTSSRTHVIEDADIIATYDLSVADLTELLTSTIDGIASIALEATLAALSGFQVSAAQGNVAPAFVLSLETLRSQLSPSQSLAPQMAALSASPCIDLGVKALIATLVSALGAPIDVAIRIVTRVQGIVGPILAKVSGLLAAIQTALTLDVAVSCVVGLSLSFNGPTVNLLLTEIEFVALNVKGMRLSVEGIVMSLLPKMCSVEAAIKSLISPGSSEFDCLIKALSNLLVNALGRLKGLLPCIENPFDALALFDALGDKIAALVGILNALLNQLRQIEAQLNAISHTTITTPTTSSIKTCQSIPLSLLTGSLKAAIGL